VRDDLIFQPTHSPALISVTYVRVACAVAAAVTFSSLMLFIYAAWVCRGNTGLRAVTKPFLLIATCDICYLGQAVRKIAHPHVGWAGGWGLLTLMMLYFLPYIAAMMFIIRQEILVQIGLLFSKDSRRAKELKRRVKRVTPIMQVVMPVLVLVLVLAPFLASTVNEAVLRAQVLFALTSLAQYNAGVWAFFFSWKNKQLAGKLGRTSEMAKRMQTQSKGLVVFASVMWSIATVGICGVFSQWYMLRFGTMLFTVTMPLTQLVTALLPLYHISKASLTAEAELHEVSHTLRAHESRFMGNILPTEGCACVASWPGIYAGLWDTLVDGSRLDKHSAAVVFLPQKTADFGKHGSDRCYCIEMYGEIPSWGCKWFQLWRQHIKKAVSLNQRLQVYYCILLHHNTLILHTTAYSYCRCITHTIHSLQVYYFESRVGKNYTHNTHTLHALYSYTTHTMLTHYRCITSSRGSAAGRFHPGSSAGTMPSSVNHSAVDR
jgi:uncharacterized membrane protein